jgi:hypothetical protein
MLFLKPLKVLHTRHMERLACDGRRLEIKCALGYIGKYRSLIKTIRAKECSPRCRVDELTAGMDRVFRASWIAAVDSLKSHFFPQNDYAL